ncbi:MAG: hypothetical protein AAF654_12910 [Myxococcota bacterium]
MLIVGQDLGSIRGYSNSECCPTPAGVTTYVGLYDVLDREAHFGGLGVDETGTPTGVDADWGAGPINLFRLASEFPNQVLSIGLYIAEAGHPGALEKLLAGGFDEEVEHLGRVLASLERPTLLRIGYEFDGHWNPGYENATRYVAAFRRVALGVRAAGATNVATVWQASASPVDDLTERKRESLERWYPGDDIVDWVGLSWFLEATRVYDSDYPVTQLELAEEVFDFARARRKPVLIAEASPQGFDVEARSRANIAPILDGESGRNIQPVESDEIWRLWYAPLFETLRRNGDVVRGFAYINANWDEQALWASPFPNGYWGDSRLETNPTLQRLWNREIRDPRWVTGD